MEPKNDGEPVSCLILLTMFIGCVLVWITFIAGAVKSMENMFGGPAPDSAGYLLYAAIAFSVIVEILGFFCLTKRLLTGEYIILAVLMISSSPPIYVVISHLAGQH